MAVGTTYYDPNIETKEDIIHTLLVSRTIVNCLSILHLFESYFILLPVF